MNSNLEVLKEKERIMKTKILKVLVLTISIVFTLCVSGIQVVNYINFQQDCSGHLERAANANSVELAEKELAIAIQYLEKHNMTKGYTSILWRTPDEDIEYFYSNLVSAHRELSSISRNATLLENSNLLMKLRETLTKNAGGDRGDILIIPAGLYKFPHNMMWCILDIILCVTICIISYYVYYICYRRLRGY